jgi:CRISPR-associated protein Cmr6
MSPTLLFHKWHAYDDLAQDQKLKTKESRLPFLERVAGLVNTAHSGYATWYGRYFTALEALGVDRSKTVITASTVWRLVAGFATNPALETGITLHLFHGFPYLPGSAVRGLARRVAEYELVETREGWIELEELPPADDLSQFLDEAEKVKAFLGSLIIEPAEKGIPLWRTPREVLRHLRKLMAESDEHKEQRTRIDALLGEHTGGRVTFFDAVPAEGEEDLLQTDLLNPHYPEYYREPKTHPPSDDQDPTPVYFLAVRPGAAFEFPFLLDPSSPEDVEVVKRWVIQGLKTWGAGAKTTAGYGYFKPS